MTSSDQFTISFPEDPKPLVRGKEAELPLPLPEMLAENRNRIDAMQQPYDPITGEGATGP